MAQSIQHFISLFHLQDESCDFFANMSKFPDANKKTMIHCLFFAIGERKFFFSQL